MKGFMKGFIKLNYYILNGFTLHYFYVVPSILQFLANYRNRADPSKDVKAVLPNAPRALIIVIYKLRGTKSNT